MRRLAVKVTKRLQKLTRPLDQLRLGRHLPSFQNLVQAFPLNIIHDRINNAVLLHKIIDLWDISVVQLFQHIHFTPQNLRLCIQRPLVRLKHHQLIQTQMPPQIDTPSAS